MTEKKKKKPISRSLNVSLKRSARTLAESLDFIEKVIKDDNAYLKRYYEKYGDLKYRPPMNGNPDELGDPTNVDLVMKADSMGPALKRLLDSLTVIITKLAEMPKEDPNLLDNPDTDVDLEDELTEPSDTINETPDKEDIKEKMRKLLEKSKVEV